MAFTTEKVMRVWNDSEGVYLEVRQNPDCPEESIEIHTDGKQKNEEWYGKIQLRLFGREQAETLAHAILEMAEQIW